MQKQITLKTMVYHYILPMVSVSSLKPMPSLPFHSMQDKKQEQNSQEIRVLAERIRGFRDVCVIQVCVTQYKSHQTVITHKVRSLYRLTPSLLIGQSFTGCNLIKSMYYVLMEGQFHIHYTEIHVPLLAFICDFVSSDYFTYAAKKLQS